MDILIATVIVALVYWLLTSAGLSLWYLLAAVVIAVIVLSILRGRRGRDTF